MYSLYSPQKTSHSEERILSVALTAVGTIHLKDKDQDLTPILERIIRQCVERTEEAKKMLVGGILCHYIRENHAAFVVKRQHRDSVWPFFMSFPLSTHRFAIPDWDKHQIPFHLSTQCSAQSSAYQFFSNITVIVRTHQELPVELMPVTKRSLKQLLKVMLKVRRRAEIKSVKDISQ